MKTKASNKKTHNKKSKNTQKNTQEEREIFLSSVLNTENMSKWTEDFNKCKNNIIIQNIMTLNSIKHITVSRYSSQHNDTVYTNRVHPVLKITDQQSAGLCWIYAGLNVIRPALAKKFHLSDDFEFSSCYLYFYDTLEKINLLFDRVEKNRNNIARLKDIMHGEDLIPDGGTFYNFQYLVSKYGLVPRNNFTKSYHCSYSGEFKEILNKMCLSTANDIINSSFKQEETVAEKKEKREQIMKEYYQLLLKFIGTPPDTFNWEYYVEDVDYTGAPKHVYQSISDLTPLTFYHCIIKKLVDVDNFISVVHDPRENYPYWKTYFGEPLSMNPYEVDISFNMPIDRIKELIIGMININRPVYFGADINQNFTPYASILDTDAFNYESFLGIEKYHLSKADRRKWHGQMYSHAMTFIGYKETNQSNQSNVSRWKFECANSWGSDDDVDGSGYLHVSDKWIDENLYEIVVHKSLLTNTEIKQYNSTPIIVPYDSL